MSSLRWCQSLHKIIFQQCSPQTQMKTLVRFLPSYRHKKRVPEPDPEPYYSQTDNDPPQDPSLITVPLKLKGRLEKKLAQEQTKYGQKMLMLDKSRHGSMKGQFLLKAKDPVLNHRKGQTYDPHKELTLASKGWRHRKSHGDHFTILPVEEDTMFLKLNDRETFESLGLNPSICKTLEEQKLESPTLIQASAIPTILEGKHNLVAAETGCGKTLAYLLPLFEQIIRKKRMRHSRKANQPYGVIVVPTRELAEQVAQVAISMCPSLSIYTRLLQAGNVRGQADNPSSKEYDILVTTIYIVSALSVMDAVDLSKVGHIVLDEADTLLDDSFSAEVLRFLGRFDFRAGPRQVQATLVSATMPKTVEDVLGEVLPVDTMNRITTPGLHSVMKNVPQKFLRVRKMDKPNIIVNLVETAIEKKAPMMIFCNKGVTCHWLGTHLNRSGLDCVAVHRGIKPGERKGLLKKYQDGEVNVIICTDLGSRGINTVRTKHVVNYEFPRFLVDYVHRCGRVGRVGSAPDGLITNLVSSAFEIEVVQQIESAVRKDESLKKVNANIKRILNSRYGMYQTINPIPDDEKQEEIIR